MEVKIFSRIAMQRILRCKKLSDCAIIAFKDIHTKYMDYRDECDMVFGLSFDDISKDDLDDLGLTLDNFMPGAEELAEFIYNAYKDNRRIICQCEYGMSRSAGCAAAILQHFEGRGMEIFTNYKYCPNLLVFHKVIDALEKHRELNNVKLYTK